MRSTSASSCRQVASSFIRSLARSSTLYSSLCPKSRPSSLAFWSITCPPPRPIGPRRAAAGKLRPPSSAHWPGAAPCIRRSVPRAAPARSPSGRSRAPLPVRSDLGEQLPASCVLLHPLTGPEQHLVFVALSQEPPQLARLLVDHVPPSP